MHAVQGEYHMYITETPHIDPLMFHLALQQNDETDAVCGAEKTAFAWCVNLLSPPCIVVNSKAILE